MGIRATVYPPAFGFKPIPDEEGTETREDRTIQPSRAGASNRSPMRRGLKHESPSNDARRNSCFKPIPDEEGTETRSAHRSAG